MKREKLSWTELRKLIAKRADVTEKEAGAFLNALVAQIIAGLQEEGQVRLTGLGIFKLQAVAPRKSVDVTTGEPIVIEGYNKLNFVPEIGVRELVNNVLPAPEISEETSAEAPTDTPLKKLSAQASEIVDLLADLGQHPVAPRKKEKPAPKEEVVEEPPAPVVEEQVPVAEEPTPKQEEAPAPAPTFEIKPLDMPIEPKPKKERKYHPLRDGLITIAIILILLCIGYFFLTKQIVKFADDLLNKRNAQTEVVQEQAEQPAQEAEQVVEPIAEPIEEQVEQPTVAQPKERVYNEFIGTENLHADSRLAWLAYKYYGGKKDLWVFIYEANKDKLDSPHKITVGTPIRIPKLSKEEMDLNNPQTRKLVDELIEKYQ